MSDQFLIPNSCQSEIKVIKSKTKIIYVVLDERINIVPPAKNTSGSAGYDLRACIEKTLEILPGEVKLISVGFKIKMDSSEMAAIILPRSGLGHKKGIVLGNLVGLIDSDYEGPLMVSLWNRSTEPYAVLPMERIAQLVFIPVIETEFVKELSLQSSGDRGENGFGSSGTN